MWSHCCSVVFLLTLSFLLSLQLWSHTTQNNHIFKHFQWFLSAWIFSLTVCIDDVCKYHFMLWNALKLQQSPHLFSRSYFWPNNVFGENLIHCSWTSWWYSYISIFIHEVHAWTLSSIASVFCFYKNLLCVTGWIMWPERVGDEGNRWWVKLHFSCLTVVLKLTSWVAFTPGISHLIIISYPWGKEPAKIKYRQWGKLKVWRRHFYFYTSCFSSNNWVPVSTFNYTFTRV